MDDEHLGPRLLDVLGESACRELLEALGLAELEHNPRNNRMRAR